AKWSVNSDLGLNEPPGGIRRQTVLWDEVIHSPLLRTLTVPGAELRIAMRRIRLELWLATTAIALVAAGLSLPVQSAPLTEDGILAAVPLPEPANLPPPTVSDIAPTPSTGSPATPAQAAAKKKPPVRSAPLTEDEISAAVPMPEPANLPPPTVSDI